MKQNLKLESLSEPERITDKQFVLMLQLMQSKEITSDDLEWTTNNDVHKFSRAEASEIIKSLIDRIEIRRIDKNIEDFNKEPHCMQCGSTDNLTEFDYKDSGDFICDECKFKECD